MVRFLADLSETSPMRLVGARSAQAGSSLSLDLLLRELIPDNISIGILLRSGCFYPSTHRSIRFITRLASGALYAL